MADFDSVKLGSTFYGMFAVTDPDTKLNKDADSLPTIAVYAQGSSTATTGLTSSVTKISTGLYRYQVAMTGGTPAVAAGTVYHTTHTALVTGTTTSQATYGPIPVDTFKVTTRDVDDLCFPTVSGRSTDVSGSGNVGIDWSNVENQGSGVSLSATTVNLVNTLTTYSGNTPQTGDAAALIGSPAGASVSADIAAVKAETNTIVGHTGTSIPSTLGSPAGASISADIAAVKVDSGQIGTAGAGLTDLGGMSTGMQGEVNAEVVDVLRTDTSTEPGQVAVPVTASLSAKVDWIFKFIRNKKDNDGATTQLYADNGTTVDQKQTTSEAAGTVTVGEWSAGP